MGTQTAEGGDPAGTPSVLSQARAGTGQDLDALFHDAAALLALIDAENLRILRINGAFDAACGRRALLGRTWAEAFGSGGADMEACIRRAISERAPQHLRSQRTDALRDPGSGAPADRFVDFLLQPLSGPQGEVAAVLLQGLDVTDAYRGEHRQRFLHALERALWEADDVAGIGYTAASRLRDHLDAQRVLSLDVDPDRGHLTITAQAKVTDEGLADTQLRLHELGTAAAQGLLSGQSWWVPDVLDDPDLAAPARERWLRLGVRALLCAPVMRARRCVAAMIVTSAMPRAWTDDEVELAGIVAARALESVERTRLERAARDNEDRYLALLRHAANIFWTAGPDGYVTEDSLSWRAFTGQTEAQWLGTGWLDAIHPEDRAILEATWPRAAREGRPIETEYRLRHVGGGWRWTSVCAMPITHPDGRIRQWVGMNTDITARKLAERRDAFLVRLDDATRPLTEPDEIARTVLRLVCEELGADRATYFEIDADGHAGTVLADHAPRLCPLQGVYPLEDYGADFAKAVRTGATYLLDDIAHARMSDAERRRFDAIQIAAELMVPLHKGDRLKATLGVFQGRPRVWKPEEIQLCHLVVQRCWDSLERARIEREVRQADRRKDEFIATLAHELRNPLAPIRNGLLLLNDLDEPGQRERLQAMMARQVEHLVRMVDDLLDVSRINRGMIELQSADVALQDTLRAAIETARPGLEALQHELRVEFPPDPVWVRGDAVRLTQVFANLLNNAAKYTNDRGRLRVALREEGAHAVVDVEDNGIGIPPSMLLEIFETFAQTPEGRLRGRGGLGIGLSLVRRLVSLHGGQVSAHSDGSDRGSRFEVRLPRLLSLPVAVPGIGSVSRDARRGGRVLVVDDNRDAADSICEVLRMDGWECVVAYDGHSALAWIEDTPIDLALLDLGMPEMDGYQLARRIRQSGHDRLVLIALTGWGQARDRALSREAGFDHHWVKPVDPESLSRLLGEALDTR